MAGAGSAGSASLGAIDAIITPTDADLIAKLPESLLGAQLLTTANNNVWLPAQWCHQEEPFLTQVKFVGVSVSVKARPCETLLPSVSISCPRTPYCWAWNLSLYPSVFHVPELPPRVVALTAHRRPAPSGAAKALFDVVRAVLPGRALEQDGVRLGSDAFPLLRSTR